MTRLERTGGSTATAPVTTSPRLPPPSRWGRGLVPRPAWILALVAGLPRLGGLVPRPPRIAAWSTWARSSQVGAVLLLVGIVGVCAFLSTGWRLFVVESPSMGTTAPVGTLVVDRPLAEGGVRVGDVISYRSPDVSAHTYTHRVVSATSAGLRAKGDINGSADPWVIPRRNVVGVVALLVPGAGWLLRLVPPIALGVSVLWVLCGLVQSATWRAGARLFSLSLVVSAVLAYFRPLANSLVLTSVPTGRHVDAAVVSTGFLPVHLQSPSGAAIDLAAGEVGRLSFPVTEAGRYTFSTALHLDPLGWSVLVLVWLLPLFAVLAIGLPVETPDQHEADVAA